MKKYLIVTVDTECDNQWDELSRRNISLKNIKEISVLQDLFYKFKVKPCYLVTYPVASDSYSVSMFKEFLEGSLCEVGAHLHSWTTPPVFDKETRLASFLHSLPSSIQEEKFVNLHNQILDNLKIEAKSYRGGRYSFDTNILRMLEEKGYLFDSSVTPFSDWSHIGGPDYTDSFIFPYFPSSSDVLKTGDSSVLEAPVSIYFDKDIPGKLKRIILRAPATLHMQGILRRLKLCKLIWLDPSFQTVAEMKKLIDILLDTKKTGYVNLMFHSSVLLAGSSPYNKTTKDVVDFYGRLESVLSYLIKDKNTVNLTPKDFVKLYPRINTGEDNE